MNNLVVFNKLVLEEEGIFSCTTEKFSIFWTVAKHALK